MFLSIIFEIISIFKRSKQNTKEHRIKEEFSRTINKFGKETKIIILICLCGFFDYIGVFFCSLINFRDTFFELHMSLLMRITEFFFVIIMYYFFLKHSLHFHHYVALGFIIIGLFLVFLEGFSAFNVFVAFSIFGNLFYASLEILYKYLMEYKFVSVFELVSISCFTGMIIGTFLCVGFSYLTCSNWMQICEEGGYVLDLKNDIKNIFSSYITIIEVTLYVLFSSGYNIFHFLTNKSLSPTHRVISDALAAIITMIITVSLEKRTNPFFQFYSSSNIW